MRGTSRLIPVVTVALVGIGCGSNGSDAPRFGGDGGPVPVIVEVAGTSEGTDGEFEAAELPEQVESVDLIVHVPDCDAPVFQAESSSVKEEGAIRFSMDLPAGNTVCFTAFAESVSAEDETLWRGITSGVRLNGTETVRVPVVLAVSPAPPPSVATDPPTDLSKTTVTLNGTVNPNGTKTKAYFEWGLEMSYKSKTPKQNIGEGTVAIPFSQFVTGLSPGTTYYYRAVAQSRGNFVYGPGRAFTTLPETSAIEITVTFPDVPPPAADTLSASDIVPNAATLNASVTPMGTNALAYFEWGEGTDYGKTTSLIDIGNGTSAVPVHQTIGEVVAGETYHFRIVAYNAGGLSVGGNQLFVGE